jgi:DNA-directed RNA polymerase subunit L
VTNPFELYYQVPHPDFGKPRMRLTYVNGALDSDELEFSEREVHELKRAIEDWETTYYD